MKLLRMLSLSLVLVLFAQAAATPEEAAVKGDPSSVDLTAIVERPRDPAIDKNAIDRFNLDVAMESARKRLLDPNAALWQEAAMYLATQLQGRLMLEEIIIQFRMTDNERWTGTFLAYTTVVRPEEVADRMIPEYIASLEMQPLGKDAIAAIRRIGTLGMRARAALPALQWARNFSPDPEQVAAAEEAIHILRGRPQGFTGC